MGEGFFFCVRVCRVDVSRVVARGSGRGAGYEFGCGGPYERERLGLGIEMGIGCG